MVSRGHSGVSQSQVPSTCSMYDGGRTLLLISPNEATQRLGLVTQHLSPTCRLVDILLPKVLVNDHSQGCPY